nr:probable serine/threonine-protein kinase At1g54610 [Ipomoea batatas]
MTKSAVHLTPLGIAQPPGPPDDRRNPRRQHQQPPPPPPQKLCNLSSFAANSATNQQGWPLWLVDVAGDAIKDWTPRRANTFEKLDKVEQLHKIFKLCGSPSEEYWKKSKLPNATLFKPQQPYKRCTKETFKDFPSSSLPLIETLLAIDPNERGTATAALHSEFFTTEPYACEPSSLPKYPPSKEMDVKLRDGAVRRQRGASGKAHGSHVADGTRKIRVRDRVSRAIPAPEANAELQANLDRWKVMTEANAKSKSEKFPPPHQDGYIDAPYNGPLSFGAPDTSFASSNFDVKSLQTLKTTSAMAGTSKRRKNKGEEPHMAPSRKLIHTFLPSSVRLSLDLRLRSRASISENFGHSR